MTSRYLVGIDLGTTNSALAFVDAKAKSSSGRPVIHDFRVPQLVAPGEMGERPLLPSALYLPGSHDLSPGAAATPWNPSARDIVGEFARRHGSHVPGRLVTSAKSWLSHAGVDRSAGLLPWGAPPEVPRISPLEASARFLRHFVDAWNHKHAADPLEQQDVVLTVPASFDDVARQLTLEAAHQSGLRQVTLLEEPQAAFYAWLHADGSRNQADQLKPGMRCLVVDVGGGTCDFSLISAVEEKGELAFRRDAVGDHLLLGGDNMDLALARVVEQRLGGAKLDAAQFSQLIQACREAKETLLADRAPASAAVTVVGRGRSVVGGTRSTELTQADLHQALYDGFFPLSAADVVPAKSARAGLMDMGLPYEPDPAVSHHLAAFLGKHRRAAGAGIDAVLFNGGVFQPQALRDRVIDILRHWHDAEWHPLVLTTPSLDLAVAQGAAAYGWRRHTGGRRIGGGIARAYYIGVDRGAVASNDSASVVCVVPRHLDEDHEIRLDQPEMELTLGAPVVFSLYTSTVRDDAAGAVLSIGRDQLLALPPLTTILRAGKRAGAGPKTVAVTLAARTTAIGTLELFCVARDGGARWRLEFNTREIVRPVETGDDGPDDSTDRAALIELVPETVVQASVAIIDSTFSPAGELDPRDTIREVETAMELSRESWPTGLCRALADRLMASETGRGRSPAHRTRWFHLLGYTLRPGYGDPLDRFRLDQLWKLLHAVKPGAAAPPLETGADVWIMWRRVAGGLPTAWQQSLFERVRPILLPGKGKSPPKPGANELAEMWRAIAALERLDPAIKVQLGDALVRLLSRGPAPTHLFWSLTRLGARVLLDGPLNGVVHPEVAARWIAAVAAYEPAHESDRRDWAFCMANLARRSGQRALEVDDAVRGRVDTLLQSETVPAEWMHMVREVVRPEKAERERLFGETFPAGLRLR